MNDRESILAGNYQLLDSLIQNRDDWKNRAEKLEMILNRICASFDKSSDYPHTFSVQMQDFSKNWKNNRENYLG